MIQTNSLSIAQFKPYLTEWHGVRIAQGVYFLVKNDAISYIGSSVNLMSRLAQHLKRKDFDEVLILEMNDCNERLMRNIENTLIKRLKPPKNKQLYTTLKFIDKDGMEVSTTRLFEMARDNTFETNNDSHPHSTFFMQRLGKVVF